MLKKKLKDHKNTKHYSSKQYFMEWQIVNSSAFLG
jgi:hypothetical protein